MKSISHWFLLIWLISSALSNAADIQRFPPPDFESGYALPSTPTPLPDDSLFGYMDAIVLLAALSLASYLVHKKRSRKGIFALMAFSLVYFGFYREGCVCAIGSIQNVTYALFHHSYTLPVTAAVFFLLPLIFSLFFGRVFCAGVCPLGAMQDLVLIKPIALPHWLRQALCIIPYLYLGAAVMFAALGSLFIICKYDPFVVIFRLSGNLNIVILSSSFLILSMFIGRPYCLFFCPYSVLLKWFSQLSLLKVTVAPTKCIQCRLCQDACPFGAITFPTPETMRQPNERDRRRLLSLMIAAPFIILLCGWMLSFASDYMAQTHYTVRLAEQVFLEETGQIAEFTDASKAFRNTGKSIESLYQEALALRNRFHVGAWMLGIFIGAVIVSKLIRLSVYRKRVDYDADRADCLACGRCFLSCPPEAGLQTRFEQRPCLHTEQLAAKQ